MDWVGFRAMAFVVVGFCVLSLVLSTGLADPSAIADAVQQGSRRRAEGAGRE